jgi:hypothetical protein
MPDPRIKCGAGKSGMTNVKMKGFSKLFILKCVVYTDLFVSAIQHTCLY